jgi:hypothetical protein
VSEYAGQPLQVTGYALVVRAYNWVGVSPDTQVVLSLIVTTPSSAAYSTVEGPVFVEDAGGAHTGMAAATAAVPALVTLQSRDATGALLTAGGSNAFVHLEELCTVNSNYFCDRTPGVDPILDGNVYQRMDDSADGKYSTTIDLKRAGRCTISVLLTKVGGFYGEYFNNAFLDGVPTQTKVDTDLNFDWGTDLLTPEAADFVSIRWYGKIRAPYTEEFTFIASGDDGIRIYMDGNLMADRWDTCCDDVSFSLNFTQDEFYDTIIEYKEHQERARFKLEWVSLSVPRQVVPPARVHYPERAESRVFELVVAPGPTITALATAEGDGLTQATAGIRAYFYLQSRDWDGRPLGNGDDDYAVAVVGPAEGGACGAANCGSFDLSATHLEGGKFLAQYVPQYSGTYTLSVTREGDRISGSDWTLIVSPGALKPSECSHSIASTPVTVIAGATYFFTLTTRDMHANLAKTRRDGTDISIQALYVDHNSWSSPLAAVPDLTDWERVYGRDIAGLAVFNNAS